MERCEADRARSRRRRCGKCSWAAHQLCTTNPRQIVPCRSSRMFRIQNRLTVKQTFFLLVMPLLCLAGCGHTTYTATVEPAVLDSPNPPPADAPISLDSARNEWTYFNLRLSHLPAANPDSPLQLQIHPFQFVGGQRAISLENISVFQVLPLPVQTDRPDFVRHTGLAVGTRELPRALLPIEMHDGVINVAALTQSCASARSPESLINRARGRRGFGFVDRRSRSHRRSAGFLSDKLATCCAGSNFAASSQVDVSVRSQSADASRPAASATGWFAGLERSLCRMYPARFEGLEARLMNRNDTVYLLDRGNHGSIDRAGPQQPAGRQRPTTTTQRQLAH